MQKIELEIVAVSHTVTQNNSYAVVLGETKGNRRLPIVIGGAEAQAIVVAMENITPIRPLTHDLMKTVFDTFDIFLSEVIVSNLMEGVFFSKLVCIQNGQEFEIDSRTSDAIALAARFGCPIYSYEFILDSAGIILEDGGTGKGTLIQKSVTEEEGKTDFSIYTQKELDQLLLEAIEGENYERAAAVRDEMKKRGKN
jgi:uncharacterized protein